MINAKNQPWKKDLFYNNYRQPSIIQQSLDSNVINTQGDLFTLLGTFPWGHAQPQLREGTSVQKLVLEC